MPVYIRRRNSEQGAAAIDVSFQNIEQQNDTLESFSRIAAGEISVWDIKYQNVILKRIAVGDASVFDEQVSMNDIEEIRDFGTCTPLVVACAHGHLEIINKLLEIDSVVENIQSMDWSLFEAVAHTADRGAVKERMFDVPVIADHFARADEAYWESLDVAAYNGELGAVNKLLKIRKPEENMNFILIALQSAVYRGNLNMVERFLEITAVRDHVVDSDYEVFKRAVSKVLAAEKSELYNGQLNVVARFLEIPAVRQHIADHDYEMIKNTVSWHERLWGAEGQRPSALLSRFTAINDTQPNRKAVENNVSQIAGDSDQIAVSMHSPMA